MNFDELADYLKGPNSFDYSSDEDIFNHLKGKYRSVDYRNEKMFIFGEHRVFNNTHHLIQLHKRDMGRVPYHTFHYIVMTYVYSGKLTMLVEGQKITLNTGDIIILDKFVPHSVLNTSANDLGVNIILDNGFFDNTIIKTSGNNVLPNFIIELMSQQYAHNHFLIFSTHNVPNFNNLIQNILCEHLENKQLASSIIDEYISILFMILTRLKPLETNFDDSNPKVQKLLSSILDYTRTDYKEGSLNILCKRINYSPSHISRVIHKHTGKTFKQLINYQRIEHAKILLQDKSLTVNEVANKVGIENLTNFYKRFEKEVGLTPMKYRTEVNNN